MTTVAVAKLIVQPGVVLVLAHFLVDGARALFEHCKHVLDFGAAAARARSLKTL